MLGTWVNFGAILLGGLLGLFLKERFSQRFKSIAMQAMALCIMTLGFQMALACERVLLMIVSMILGAWIGEALRIEDKLENLGTRIKQWIRLKDGRFSEAFAFTTVLYCVGSLAILGSIEAGLNGKMTILYAKSIMDGVISIALAASMGAGVLFSAFPVLLYQGAITLGASEIRGILTPEVVAAISTTGGLLVLGIGLNMLKLTRLPLGNFLPAIFVAAFLAAVSLPGL